MINSNHFEHIEQELTLLQQRLIALETENTDLRQQLTLLRSGHGIRLEIGGQRFSMHREQATTENKQPREQAQAEVLPVQKIDYAATPVLRHAQELEQDEKIEEEVEEEEREATPTFLEEVLLDEFTVATTNNPMATWTGPIQPTKKNELIDEDRKAALRRELVGSFLLE